MSVTFYCKYCLTRECCFFNTCVNNAVHKMYILSLSYFSISNKTCINMLSFCLQSDIASERPGMFDVVKEGLRRITRLGTPQTTRLLPIYLLVLPTALHSLLHYIITQLVQHLVVGRLRPEEDYYRSVSSTLC